MTTERDNLKEAIKLVEEGLYLFPEKTKDVLRAAKAYLETLPEQVPLDWMEEGQVVEVWHDDSINTNLRHLVKAHDDGSVSVRSFPNPQIGITPYDHWRLPEARAIKHNGNGENPCPWGTVVRRYGNNTWARVKANVVNWSIPCEFIILPEGW